MGLFSKIFKGGPEGEGEHAADESGSGKPSSGKQPSSGKLSSDKPGSGKPSGKPDAAKQSARKAATGKQSAANRGRSEAKGGKQSSGKQRSERQGSGKQGSGKQGSGKQGSGKQGSGKQSLERGEGKRARSKDGASKSRLGTGERRVASNGESVRSRSYVPSSDLDPDTEPGPMSPRSRAGARGSSGVAQGAFNAEEPEATRPKDESPLLGASHAASSPPLDDGSPLAEAPTKIVHVADVQSPRQRRRSRRAPPPLRSSRSAAEPSVSDGGISPLEAAITSTTGHPPKSIPKHGRLPKEASDVSLGPDAGSVATSETVIFDDSVRASDSTLEPSRAEPAASKAASRDASSVARRNGTSPGRLPGPSSNGKGVSPEQVFTRLKERTVAHLADLIFELSWGAPSTEWLEATQQRLKALEEARREVMGDKESPFATFAKAVEEVRFEQGAQVTGDNRDRLTQAYEALRKKEPRVRSMEEVCVEREGLLSRVLLLQVNGISAMTVDKLKAAGVLTTGDLVEATYAQIAEAGALPLEVAKQASAKVRAFRKEHLRSTPTRISERRRLSTLLSELRAMQRAFENAAAGWSSEARSDKMRLRRSREATLLQLQAELVRMGEPQRVIELDRVPFGRKIELLESFVESRKRAATSGE